MAVQPRIRVFCSLPYKSRVKLVFSVVDENVLPGHGSVHGRKEDDPVRDLVDRLAPRYRRIVNMRYFDELSYEEIAKQLNIPLGTVKIQLRRARLLLAEIIKSQKHSL